MFYFLPPTPLQRQVLRKREAAKGVYKSGNPPAVLAPQRTGSPYPLTPLLLYATINSDSLSDGAPSCTKEDLFSLPCNILPANATKALTLRVRH